uniref:GM09534p n=1 Tax=Drosophila melanogaster TaxID=7227 RepID=Q8T9J0_DROME|nr:GM09534p [Drosophila melanogaster]
MRKPYQKQRKITLFIGTFSTTPYMNRKYKRRRGSEYKVKTKLPTTANHNFNIKTNGSYFELDFRHRFCKIP